MAKKVLALLVVCAVIAAALHVQHAEARADTDTFKNCQVQCNTNCKGDGDYGFPYCEVQCHEKCNALAAAAKLNAQKNN